MKGWAKGAQIVIPTSCNKSFWTLALQKKQTDPAVFSRLLSNQPVEICAWLFSAFSVSWNRSEALEAYCYHLPLFATYGLDQVLSPFLQFFISLKAHKQPCEIDYDPFLQTRIRGTRSLWSCSKSASAELRSTGSLTLKPIPSALSCCRGRCKSNTGWRSSFDPEALVVSLKSQSNMKLRTNTNDLETRAGLWDGSLNGLDEFSTHGLRPALGAKQSMCVPLQPFGGL